MAGKRIESTLPGSGLASERQSVSRSLAVAEQHSFVWDRDSKVTALYAIARRALAKRGGGDALRAALDERESYLATISKAFHQQDGRSVPIDWLVAICEDPEARYELVSGINELFDFEPPVSSRTASDEEVGAAARELLREMDDEHREVYRKKLARKLGKRLEDVKL